jgi:hypothetical protein
MEFPTLSILYEHVKQTSSDSTILYMHTKGVNQRKYAEHWRRMHTFCLVEHWGFCQRVLATERFSSVGCNLQELPELHYSGAFAPRIVHGHAVYVCMQIPAIHS